MHLLVKKQNCRAGFIILIDPDKIEAENLATRIKTYDEYGVDLFFIGSSQPLKSDIGLISKIIKSQTTKPLIIFPGSPEQLTPEADGVLFISLISGRNPEYLIGNHVQAAPYIKKMGLQVLPTAYVLIDSGKATSVQRISQTEPLPATNPSLIAAHALAGEMLGMRYVYLEAGSGADRPISLEIIREVKSQISIPLIVGGGIREPEMAAKMVEAGADFIVVGNLLEKNRDQSIIQRFVEAVK